MTEKKAIYDDIASDYKLSKQLPFRKHLEEYTLFKLLGDLSGKEILDLACGEGIYSRRIKSLGAAKVLGVDLSPEMVNLAREEELKNPQGLEFLVKDAGQPEVLGSYDIVLASYLLNYAKAREELRNFLFNIHQNLKPGGRLVGINDNPANPPEDYALYKKYGIVKSTPTPRIEGDPITYTLLNPDGKQFQFDNFYLSPKTYEETFKEMGFQSFRWHPLELDPRESQEFWDDFLVRPPLICFEAIK